MAVIELELVFPDHVIDERIVPQHDLLSAMP